VLEDGPLTGFKLLHELRTVESKTPTVMLLESMERELVVGAFRGGARGVYGREYSFNALPKCIRKVHEGQVWVSNMELQFLLDLVISKQPLTLNHTGGMARLTPRERDVVRLVADGMRNQEIALNLHLSEHTVRNYMIKIFDKLQILFCLGIISFPFKSSGPNSICGPMMAAALPKRVP
jgi:DNA-binding NarL/FixJ family response regulator